MSGQKPNSPENANEHQPTELSHADREGALRYAQLNRVVHEGLTTALNVCVALYQISTEILYLHGGYRTFVEFTQKEHGLAKSTIHQYFNAGRVYKLIAESTDVESKPQNEAQLRPLLDIESQREVIDIWSEAQKLCGDGPLTQGIVAEAKRLHLKMASKVVCAATESSSRLKEEFIVVLWEDDQHEGSRAPEKSYPVSVYPNLAFFRLGPVGNSGFPSKHANGMERVALFSVPVEPEILLKDRHGICLCKACCRHLSLAARGNVPQPKTIPTQVVDGGFKGVLRMIERMWPDIKVRAISTTNGEEPKGWQLVPRRKSTSGDAAAAVEHSSSPSIAGGDSNSSGTSVHSGSKLKKVGARERVGRSGQVGNNEPKEHRKPSVRSNNRSTFWPLVNWKLTNGDLANIWGTKIHNVKITRYRKQAGSADQTDPERYQQWLAEEKAKTFKQSHLENRT